MMMEIALAVANTSGRPYVTVAAEQNAVANRRMLAFAEATKCLYDDAVGFTLNPGGTIPTDGVYHLRSSGVGQAFGKSLFNVDAVYIDGNPLYTLGDNVKPGVIGLPELRERYPRYLVDAAHKPLHAAMISAEKLRLYPVPDQAYSNCFVSGHVLPTDIDTSPTGDTVALPFNEEDCETVAIYVGIGLVEWTSASESDYERMAFFSKPAADRMQVLTNKGIVQMEGASVRGGRRTQRSYYIG